MAKGYISVDSSQLNRVASELKGLEKEMPGAISSALNRAVDHGVTQIGRIVPKVYAIKQAEVKGAIRKELARKGELAAGIVISGQRLTFVHFPLSPKLPNSGRNIKVKIKHANGKKEVRISPRPFIASTGASSLDKIQYNVFVRTGDKRLPIKVLRTLSIPQMVENEDVKPQVVETIDKKLNERITHEINYRLDKMKTDIKKG